MAIELEDGTIVRSLPEQVDYLTTHNEENEIAIDNLAARLEAAIAGVLHYKGSVATYADLPADAEVGDVYNVIDTGANYAWTGSEWDELGSSIDISSLVDLTSAQTITGVKTFSNGIKTNSVEQTGSVLKLGRGGYDIEFRDPIYPDSNLYDIGKSSNKWRDLYLDRIAYIGNSVKIGQYNTYVETDNYGSIVLRPDGSASVRSFSNLTNLGSRIYKWNSIFFGGYLSDGNNASYGYTLPNSTSLTANSELLDTASAQTITESKTMAQGAKLAFVSQGNTYSFAVDNTWTLGLATGNNINFRWSNSAYYPNSDNTKDLGQSAYKWKDLYLSGNLTDGTNSVTIADLKALIDYAKAQGWIS